MAIFFVGLFVAGVLGTSTSMTFIWPGYFVLGLAGVLLVGTLFRRVSFSLPRWTTIAVLLLTAYLLLRAAESPVAYFAREDAALVLACFLAYAGFLSFCDSSQRRQALVLLLGALVFANLLFATLQTIFGAQLWLIPGYQRTVSDRVGGLFNHPDHYAAFLAATVPLWLGLATFGRDSLLRRRCWLGFAAICSLATLLSGGWAGWLTWIAGTGTFLAVLAVAVWKRLKPSVRRRALVASTICILAGTVGLVAGSGHLSRQLGHGLFEKNGEASLPVVWTTGLRQVGESPWIGTGSRTSYIYGRTYRSEQLGAEVREPEFVHNEILQVLGDYGAVGLFLLLSVLVLHLGNGWRFVAAYRNFAPSPGEPVPRSDHLALVSGALGAVVAMGTVSLFDFAMHLPVFAILASTLLAVLAAPDPMATALASRETPTLFPGGGLLFATRSVAFGCGVVMVFFGFTFSRSEFHYEKARLAFESDSGDFRQFRHLQEARTLDPQNPFALSLSAHAQIAGITADMATPARRQALEKADHYFTLAQRLYPQDVFAAIGHAAVLDELGKKGRARHRLREAREWAPLYGNLMLAEAEHHLRHGEIRDAENSYHESLHAAAFRDAEAAVQGLETISEWKLIAAQNGIRWEEDDPDSPGPEQRRTLPEAKVEEREFAGEAIPEPGEWEK